LKVEHCIDQLCETFEVSPSGYYDWYRRQEQPCERQQQDEQLKIEIARIHEQSRQTYGAPRVQMHLRGQDRHHGRNPYGQSARTRVSIKI
jgi:putative transposase